MLEDILQEVRRQLVAMPGHAGMNAALETVRAELVRQPVEQTLLFLRANLLDNLGRSRESMDAYAELLKTAPGHLGALNNMGNLLFAAGKKAEARELYLHAVATHPNDAVSHVNLANLMIQGKEQGEAKRHFELALKIDPKFRNAHAGLSFVHADLGNYELAAWHRGAAFDDRCVVELPYRGDGPPITVLEFVSACGGGVKLQGFLTDRIFKVYLVATEFYKPGTALPAHDLVVNAIGDAELDARGLVGAVALLREAARPEINVINPPAVVLPTSREDVAQRLAGVPGVVTAKTLTVRRELLVSAEAARFLAEAGFAFPLLLRTPGFHGGENFLRVESAEFLPMAVGELPGDELIVIEYLNAAGADGKSRKYRVMMVDGRLYPLHAAISSNWKIHYFSAEMADSAEHRAEDGAFLTGMPSVVGPKAMAALEEIQKVLGLDYGGIDFGLNEWGEVLLFEANATMAVIPPEADARWDYRRPAVDLIYRAILKMLLDRAGYSLPAQKIA